MEVMPLAQIPGAESAISEASKAGWVSVVLCIIILGTLALMGFLFKWFVRNIDKRHAESFERENGMRVELAEVQRFIRETMAGVIRENTNSNTSLSEHISSIRDVSRVLAERTLKFDTIEAQLIQIRALIDVRKQ